MSLLFRVIINLQFSVVIKLFEKSTEDIRKPLFRAGNSQKIARLSAYLKMILLFISRIFTNNVLYFEFSFKFDDDNNFSENIGEYI